MHRVCFVDELTTIIKEDFTALLSGAEGGAPLLHVLQGVNSDSGIDIAVALPLDDDLAAVVNPEKGGIEGLSLCKDVCYDVLATARVTKSPAELTVMRYSSWVSSMAHVEVMREIKPGIMEYQLEVCACQSSSHCIPSLHLSLSPSLAGTPRLTLLSLSRGPARHRHVSSTISPTREAAVTAPTPAYVPAVPTPLYCTTATPGLPTTGD